MDGIPRPRARTVWMLLLACVMLVPLLTACGPDAKSEANANKAKLDTEVHAATSAGVPQRRLAAIIAQENSLAASTASGSDSAYQAAADGYSQLYNQVVALEKETPDQAKDQATSDLQAFQTALAAAEGTGTDDITTAAKLFDPAVPLAQQQLAAAKTLKDFFAVDGYILDQTAAVTQIQPDYEAIQSLTDLVSQQTAALAPAAGKAHVLECATEGGEIPSYGTVPAQFWNAQNDYPIYAKNPIMVTPQAQAQTYYFSAWPDQAMTDFKAAKTADDFLVLGTTLQAEIGTLKQDSDPNVLAHNKVAAELARFQSQVNTYQTDITANNAFLKDRRAKAKDVPTYTSVWNLTQNPNGWAAPQDFYPNVPDFKADPKYAQQAQQDAAALDKAQTSTDLSNVLKSIQKHEQGMNAALVKVEAFYDTNITLQALIDKGQSTTTNVTYAGKLYKTPNAYEYADDDLRYDAKDTVGIKDAQIRLAQAAYRESRVSASDSNADYQAIEDEAQMFIHNLTAMISNLEQMPKNNKDREAWSMTAHQSDYDLISYYGLTHTRVIVVSLREQKARLFDNDKLVVGSDGKPYAFDVTTGSPDKPTVPGIHCALPPLKGPPGGDLFKSPDAPGSPFYYKPTPVHYSFGYSLYGYYIHDGWWRDDTEMGYLTNLPHYDPAAFNGGSHGCVNFHYSNGDMGKVYNFSTAGIPIIIY